MLSLERRSSLIRKLQASLSHHEDGHKLMLIQGQAGVGQALRGSAAILFISRDTFSDSIAKNVRVCFPGVSHKYRAICCEMGYCTYMSVSKKAPRGGIAPCWGIAGMAEKVSRDRGYRSDTLAISRDMGPLRASCYLAFFVFFVFFFGGFPWQYHSFQNHYSFYLQTTFFNLFLIKLVRISGFSSLFSAIAVFLALSGKMC